MSSSYFLRILSPLLSLVPERHGPREAQRRPSKERVKKCFRRPARTVSVLAATGKSGTWPCGPWRPRHGRVVSTQWGSSFCRRGVISRGKRTTRRRPMRGDAETTGSLENWDTRQWQQQQHLAKRWRRCAKLFHPHRVVPAGDDEDDDEGEQGVRYGRSAASSITGGRSTRGVPGGCSRRRVIPRAFRFPERAPRCGGGGRAVRPGYPACPPGRAPASPGAALH